MGTTKFQGRDALLLVLLVVLIAACAWSLGLIGGSSGADSDGDGSSAEPARSSRPATTEPEGGQRLIAAEYEPGDCVMYRVGNAAPADTDVVPCTEEHRVQIAARVDIEIEGTAYPTVDEWLLTIESECRPAAEAFLGRPLDPYGRFVPRAIRPTEEGWRRGDRDHIWCGIGWAGPADGTSARLFAEDVREADLAYHHPRGTCLSTASGSVLVVDCAEPHDKEIVGEIDLSDRSERPVDPQDPVLVGQCAAHARTYLGADPVMPWQVGRDAMPEESWAAGTRVVHCFLAQWDAQDKPVEITGSAKG